MTPMEYLQDTIAGNGAIRIAYTTQGEPTAAIIKDNYSVLDHKLFQTVCQSAEEAHYVLAIINSNALTKAAETFMTKGLYGARDFHKHGWKLPIPRYNASDSLHLQLSELGASAEHECAALIAKSEIPSNPPGNTQSRAARSLLRHEWQPNSKTAQAIETAVAKLLSDPAQAKLAEHQMTNK